MNRKTLTLIAAGLAALALTLIPAASAATIYDLANLGYATTNVDLGGGCTITTADGFGSSWSGNTCDPGYQGGLDGFYNGHPERKLGFQHGDAVAARGDLQGKGYTVSTDYAGPSFHVSGGCNVDATEGPAGLVSLDGTLGPAAPCPPTSPPPTDGGGSTAPPVSPPPTGGDTACDIQCQIAALQAQIDELRGELTHLVQILEAWPGIDPGILAQLMSIQP